MKREDEESKGDVWKRILEVERSCEFEKISAAELVASIFLSEIVKSTGDYDLKKIFRKSNVSMEAITEALHKYMYERLNNSLETEDEKKIRYLNKRKTRSTKEPLDKPAKFKYYTTIDAEHLTGLDSTNARLEERNVRNAKSSATTRNAVEQTKE